MNRLTSSSPDPPTDHTLLVIEPRTQGPCMEMRTKDGVISPGFLGERNVVNVVSPTPFVRSSPGAMPGCETTGTMVRVITTSRR